jgi:hypothetical protein
MGRYISQCDLGGREVTINGGCRGRNDHTRWDLAHAQHNLGDEFPSCYRVEFVNECRLEERELV